MELEHRLRIQVRCKRSGLLWLSHQGRFATLMRLCALFVNQLLDHITGFVHVFLTYETIGATGTRVSLRKHKSNGGSAAVHVIWGIHSDHSVW